MSISSKSYAKGLISLVSALSMPLLSLCKVSFMVGSYAAFFSLTSCAYPLAGVWMSRWAAALFFGLLALVKLALVPQTTSLVLSSAQMAASLLLAVHLPGIFSAIAMSSRSWITHIALPFCCITVFVMHPEGGYAAPYALFWLIPIALYATRASSFFARTLSAGFIAHGVGSVLWLWAKPAMTASMWMALIPVVMVERLVFALGTAVIYYAVTAIMNHMRAQQPSAVASAGAAR